MAERSELSLRYIVDLENGKATGVKYAAKIAAVFGVPLNEIWHK